MLLAIAVKIQYQIKYQCLQLSSLPLVAITSLSEVQKVAQSQQILYGQGHLYHIRTL